MSIAAPRNQWLRIIMVRLVGCVQEVEVSDKAGADSYRAKVRPFYPVLAPGLTASGPNLLSVVPESNDSLPIR